MCTRRELLIHMIKGAAVVIVPGFSKAAISSLVPEKLPVSGKLSFYNIHTRENLSLRYLNQNRRFEKSALNELNHFFRCHYTGKEYPIKAELFLLLDEIRTRLGKTDRKYRLISGYRSPEYNRKLFRTSSGVAKKSYHLFGMAADVRLEGIGLEKLRQAALELRKGGVGKYSQFIHIDVGPARWW